MPSQPEHLRGVLIPIILGSIRDRDHGKKIAAALARFGIASELRVGSAHKSTVWVLQMLAEYAATGQQIVYITVAGRSNALSGVVDAQSLFPVLACPPPAAEQYGGMDLLSSLRMPSGVAPLVVLDPEAAALATVKILALSHPELAQRLAAERAITEDQARADDRTARADQGTTM